LRPQLNRKVVRQLGLERRVRSRSIALGAIALTLVLISVLLVAQRAPDQPTVAETLVPKLLGSTPYQTGWRCRPTGLRTWRALWRADQFCTTERRGGPLLDTANLERDARGRLILLGRVWGLGERRNYADAARDSIMTALAPWVTTGRPCPLLNDEPRRIDDLPRAELRGWALPGYAVIIQTSVGRDLSGPVYGVSVQVIPGGVFGCGARRRAA
jgi:hypothetical protein